MTLVQIILPPLTISGGKQVFWAASPAHGYPSIQGETHHALEGAGVFLVWAMQKLLAHLSAEQIDSAHLQLPLVSCGMDVALATKSSPCCASLISPLSSQVLPGVSLPVFLAWSGLALL